MSTQQQIRIVADLRSGRHPRNIQDLSIIAAPLEGLALASFPRGRQVYRANVVAWLRWQGLRGRRAEAARLVDLFGLMTLKQLEVSE